MGDLADYTGEVLTWYIHPSMVVIKIINIRSVIILPMGLSNGNIYFSLRDVCRADEELGIGGPRKHY